MSTGIETTDTENMVQLRVSVAKMEGMLTQALTDQGARITRSEGEIVAIHGRLNEKAKLLATHDERINSNTHRVEELEESRDGAQNRFLAILAGVVGTASLVYQFIQPHLGK